MKHIEGRFKGYNGLGLYYQYWLPEKEPRAILLVVHGMAEHSGRYANLVEYFVPKGYAVCSFDLRGNGRSDGLRGYVEQFSAYVYDLKTFFDMLRDEYKDTRIFLVGHSMGGTIATVYAIHYQDGIDGLILSGATLKVGGVSWGLIIVARILSLFLPKIGIYVIDASTISRDKAVVDAYENDPLVYRGKIRARLGVELIKTTQVLSHQMSRINLPILIMHGSADRLSYPEGSELLYQRVGSKDKALKFYEGFYHEIFNEPGCQQVFADMESWLNAHIS